MTIDSKALAEPFPRELLRTHPEKKLSYVPISEVVARLNKVLGVTGWGYEVIRVWEAGQQPSDTGVYPLWVMAHVRLTVYGIDDTGEYRTAVDGIGGQSVKMLKSGKGPLDLGDEYKGAVSDALKKAAQHLGVGLELARKDEALEWEAQHDAPQRCPRDDCGAEVPPGREAMRTHFVDAHGYRRLPDGKVAPPAEREEPPNAPTANEEHPRSTTADQSSSAPPIEQAPPTPPGSSATGDRGRGEKESTGPADPTPPARANVQRKLFAQLRDLGVDDNSRHGYVAAELGRPITSFTEISEIEMQSLTLALGPRVAEAKVAARRTA